MFKKESYDINSSCNWVHAEIMAIKALPKDSKPFKAILYGHNFYCNPCELALKRIGVEILEIRNIEDVEKVISEYRKTFK